MHSKNYDYRKITWCAQGYDYKNTVRNIAIDEKIFPDPTGDREKISFMYMYR